MPEWCLANTCIVFLGNITAFLHLEHLKLFQYYSWGTFKKHTHTNVAPKWLKRPLVYRIRRQTAKLFWPHLETCTLSSSCLSLFYPHLVIARRTLNGLILVSQFCFNEEANLQVWNGQIKWWTLFYHGVAGSFGGICFIFISALTWVFSNI